MKKVLILLLTFLVLTAGIVFALQNKIEKSTKNGDILMGKKILVAYFSATGTTKRVAENLAKAINADIYEIKPEKPYSDADLDWTNKNSRSSVEMQDYKSRPAMAKDDFSVSEYDVVFLGFPIWWYIAPTIVNTFLEKHDFSGKTIVIFATSGGSGFGKTIENLKPSVDASTKFIQGKVLNSNPDVEELKSWAESLK